MTVAGKKPAIVSSFLIIPLRQFPRSSHAVLREAGYSIISPLAIIK
jgi:hypothetical protein